MRLNSLKNRFNKKIAAIKLRLLFLCIIAGLSTYSSADETDEYTLKSAFLYNFSLFTTWPEHSFTTFDLCIYGDDPFGKNFDVLLEDKTIRNHSIVIHRINQLEQLTSCQLVYISRSERKKIPEIVNSLADHSVLTIADSPDACLQGVMLNMNVENDKITFEANLKQAKKANLTLNAQLLRLATKVY